ncbi:hypothetical protein FRB94_006854 [Tulasnella sp. JGI-2019a]|nr:hypothetical protein FRB94_006854 [Tulasnella sp. JGI-2019a]KAG9017771.1 hypothetical protein FRB93_004582 [Tulasnella sp. JGI-2019a]KAG9035840.1 hypothetical protein FRB95_010434 [Tulasnella sp. JGI-2019a]
MASLCSFDTIYCADSVEFCPHPLATDILVCGTYQLQKPDASHPTENQSPIAQRRLGRCYIFSVDNEGVLTELQRVDLPAIPDMKWSHTYTETNALFAIADAEGSVTLYRWSLEKRELQEVQKIRVRDPTNLCLSLDWSDRRHVSSGAGNSIVVSSSDGTISILAKSDTGEMDVALSWKAHEFEPWVATWDYWARDVVYSGGDDCKLKGWDVREGGSKATFVNNSFDAGVTTIQSHPHTEHMLAVGSYDATVRLYDTRKPLTPLLQMNIGGGAWRVKWHPDAAQKDDLLVACMHGGFKVLRIAPEISGFAANEPSGNQGYEYLARFEEDCPSLAYGVDWSFRSDQKEGRLIAGCSFYDHTVRTWRV